MSTAIHSQEASLPHPQSWDIPLCVCTHSPGWWPSTANHQASFYQGIGSSKHPQLSETFMAAKESSSLTSVKDYTVDMAAKSDARFKRAIFRLLFDRCSWNFSFPPFKENAGCPTFRKKKGWSLALIKLGFFKTESAGHHACPPAQLFSVLHNENIEFQGNWGNITMVLCSLSLPKSGVRQRACTWPGEIWAKRNSISSARSICTATVG